jgi:hypothetical protein
LSSGAIRPSGNHRRPPESTGDGAHEPEQPTGNAGILEETSGGDGPMSDVVTTWIVVQHSDTEQAAKWHPGGWIVVSPGLPNEEKMQIIDIEQLKHLQDRVLVARFPETSTEARVVSETQITDN